MILHPPALQVGDTIAFISPSNRLNHIFPQRIERAKHWFESQGYRVRIIDTLRLSEGYEARLRARCDEIHEAFRDTAVKAIICTIGGQSCNELLEYIDYEIIRQNPKIFCGYSDITLLHQAFLTRAGLGTFYGPAAIPNFGEHPQPLAYTANSFLVMVGGQAVGVIPPSQSWSQVFLDWMNPKTDQQPRDLAETACRKWLRGGKVEGRLLGGCLPSVLQLIGTEYAPDYAECILLLETPEADHAPDAPFSLTQARRCMNDLRNAGVLHKIAGIMVGRPFMYTLADQKAFEDMILQLCRDTTFPILAGIDSGHTHPIMTLPLGCRIRLDADEDTIMIIDRPITDHH